MFYLTGNPPLFSLLSGTSEARQGNRRNVKAGSLSGCLDIPRIVRTLLLSLKEAEKATQSNEERTNPTNERNQRSYETARKNTQSRLCCSWLSTYRDVPLFHASA